MWKPRTGALHKRVDRHQVLELLFEIVRFVFPVHFGFSSTSAFRASIKAFDILARCSPLSIGSLPAHSNVRSYFSRVLSDRSTPLLPGKLAQQVDGMLVQPLR